MSEDEQEEKKSGILNSVDGLSERILETNKSANVLIIILVLIVAISFLSIGIAATRGAAPVDTSLLDN